MELSPLIRACEKAWESIQYHFPDVPDVVIVVGSGGRRSSTLLGHFAKNSWGTEDQELHEVLLVAENLKREATDVFQTLLHEAGHGLAHVRGVKDTSGARHNKKFAAICGEFGMEPPEYADPKLGFSAVRLTPALIELFAGDIAAIDEELKLCRKLVLETKTTKKTTWIAECSCRKIRMPKKSIVDPDLLSIECKNCGDEFALNEDERDSYMDTVGA